MNKALLEAFRHNEWATKELLSFSRDLSEERLRSPAAGTYGDIMATFNHLILAEAGYFRSLSGNETTWAVKGDESADLSELVARVEDLERLWERFLSEPVDADRIIILDAGTYEAHAGVIVAQVLNHGNVHREQICSILTGLGIEPPDIQAWAYGDATGRGGPRKT
jgi:uncharacterized damage-inducible protein DinB